MWQSALDSVEFIRAPTPVASSGSIRSCTLRKKYHYETNWVDVLAILVVTAFDLQSEKHFEA